MMNPFCYDHHVKDSVYVVVLRWSAYQKGDDNNLQKEALSNATDLNVVVNLNVEVC